MKEKSWWIYQDRKVDEPWALHVTARKDRRRIRGDTEVYAEWIRTPSKSMLIADTTLVALDTWLESIGYIMDKFGHPLTVTDIDQLKSEIAMLKQSFED